jgi:hypothetical protein
MSERVNYPHKVCPVHGVPMRRVGPNYYCDFVPAPPPSELDLLRADNARLQALNVQLADRVAAQSDLLTKKAMRRPPQGSGPQPLPEGTRHDNHQGTDHPR